MSLKTSLLFFVLLWSGLFLIATPINCRAELKDHDQPLPQIEYNNHLELDDYLQEKNYDWDTLNRGVPRFILTNLPDDMEKVPQVTDKKRIFFLSLLPMVLMANNEILAERKRLIELKAPNASRHNEIKAHDVIWVQQLARDYGIKKDPLTDPQTMEKLLRRVDQVPASLVLAQAANESGWGTSRFARLANNLFGEWTFKPGTGITPRDRPEGETYEVKRFKNLLASIRSYLHNINTHWAYRELRNKRAELRSSGQPLRGLDLAQHLELYSTRRQAYVEELRRLIRSNNLTRLTDVYLRRPEAPVQPPTYGLFSAAKFSGRHQQRPEKSTTD